MNKRILIRCAASTAASALAAALVSLSPFHEPVGRIYDRLKAERKHPAPARELLIIEADSAAVAAAGAPPWGPEEWSETLYLLAEMECARLVSDLPVLDTAATYHPGDQSLADSIDRELSRVSKNVQTLFDAIRLGSVRPKDAGAYVAELIGLTESAKTRLKEQAIGAAREIDKKPAEAAAVLGSVFFPPVPLSDIELETAGATFSRHGASAETGSAVFAALLDRLDSPTVLKTADMFILREALLPDGARVDLSIPLYDDSTILFDLSNDIRRISFEALFRHRRLEAELAQRLSVMERAGYPMANGAEPNPLAAYEFAEGIRAELAAAAPRDRSLVGEWRTARARFFESTDAFLSGSAEKKTIDAFDALLASSDLDVEGRVRVARQKDEAAAAFAAARTTAAELAALRAVLRKELTGAFCFVGPSAAVGASFVQAVFENRFIRTARIELRFSAIFAAGFAVGLILLGVRRRWVFLTTVLGCAAAASTAAAGIFIAYGVWLSPAAMTAGPIAAAAASMIAAGIGARKKRAEDSGVELTATVLVVRAKGLHDFDPTAPARMVAAFRIFRQFVTEELESRGASVRAAEGETISATFEDAGATSDRAVRACEAAFALVSDHEGLRRALETAGVSSAFPPLRAGLEDGPCVVGRAGESGGLLLGPTATRAKILAGIADRYDAAILVSENIFRRIDGRFDAKRLDRLDDVFYRINGVAENR